nr:LamG domain-containing protein [Micromonospora sp. DSM 115978]
MAGIVARNGRILASAPILAMVALLGVTNPSAAVAAGSPAAVVPDSGQSASVAAEANALGAARRSGTSVEVAGSRSESARAIATPQGTLVHESYPVPRWTTGADGRWREIDTNLRVGEFGAVTPIATLAPVRFSSGGSDPVVTVPLPGGQLSLSWPDALPAPRVVGDTAVYESVYDGVDLHMRALVDGFTWVVVVHSAEAADNPALQRLTFGLSASGVEVRGRSDGGFEAVDSGGAPLLSAGSALMWDSAGLPPAARGAEPAARSDDLNAVTRVMPDLSTKAELPATVTDSTLEIVPDLGLLRGPETIYPVIIDPSVTINKARWGYANSGNENRNDGVARVGEDPEGSGVSRSFFAFTVSSLHGKQIQSVNFATEMTHSHSCSPTPVNLWRTASLASPGRHSWSGPGLAAHLMERSGNAHKPSPFGGPGCSDDPQPNMYLEFVNGDLRTDLTSFVGNGYSNYSVALTARKSNGTGESTQSWWKKFDPAKTKLSVVYNTPPSTPTAAQLATHSDHTAPANACVTGTGRPAIRSTTPWLKAVLTDPDGSAGGTLAGSFALQKWNGTDWAAVAGWPKTSAKVAPGAKAEMRVPAVVEGDRYRWQVRTTDASNSNSNWSPWCEFDIDETPPQVTPTVASEDGIYLESPPGGDNQDLRGGIGQTGQFTFGANGETDVYSYVYQVAGGPELTVTTGSPGGSATVWATPSRIGENVLTVRSRDQAGNRSDPYDYVFLVGEATAPTASWLMNEGQLLALNTTPPGGPGLSLSNPVALWDEGRVTGEHGEKGQDYAVIFDGINDYAVTSDFVIHTDRSFSISAWVRPGVLGGQSRAVVSQQGENRSVFELSYESSRQRWCLLTYLTDAVGAPAAATPACSTSAPKMGVWAHLTGVYDAGAGGQTSLYVNGVLEGSGVSSTMWAGEGGINIGSGWNGASSSLFNGAIDDVRVWQRVVDSELDIKPLLEPVLVGQWEMEDFDEEAPRLSSDESGYNRHAALADSPATEWCDGYGHSIGVCLRQADGLASTAARALNTRDSYTVSAWVKPTALGYYPSILSQCGIQRCAFYLQARNDPPVWAIVLPSADQVEPAPAYHVASAPTPAVPETWVHLAAVHDATRAELRLYVDGQLAAVRTGLPAMWQANGPLRIGRADTGDSVAGAVDRVRVWQGALTDGQIAALWAEP